MIGSGVTEVDWVSIASRVEGCVGMSAPFVISSLELLSGIADDATLRRRNTIPEFWDGTAGMDDMILCG